MIAPASPHPLLVPADLPFDAAAAPTSTPREVADRSKKDWKAMLDREREILGDWQYKLYADGRFAVLLVFQALDAAGKDSTIRHVFSGVNPTGLHVHSFKRPSTIELAHDFLWRTTLRLPERGHVAIFNRSYYEEVLVVRVHPQLLAAQRHETPPPDGFWAERLRAIAAHEQQLANEGTLILKFWLNHSAEEQRRRFLERIEDPAKNWKFNAGDLDEAELRPAYLAAYSEALAATSRPWAPWYVIPADDKHYLRWQVAALVNTACARLGVDFPRPDAAARAELGRARARLLAL